MALPAPRSAGLSPQLVHVRVRDPVKRDAGGLFGSFAGGYVTYQVRRQRCATTCALLFLIYDLEAAPPFLPCLQSPIVQ